MSVFLGLTITMIMSLFFSMTEVTRYFCIAKEEDSATTLAVQNVFGEYLKPLWEDYRLLALDMSYGQDRDDTELLEEHLSSYFSGNGPDEYMEGVDLLQAGLSDCDAYNLVLLTDNDGAPLIKDAAKFELSELPTAALSDLVGIHDQSASVNADPSGVESMVKSVGTLMLPQNLTEAAEEDSYQLRRKDKGSKPGELGVAEGNPAETGDSGEVNGLNRIVLGQVLEDVGSVSNMGFLAGERVSGRPLLKGDGYCPGVSATERILFQYYLTRHFASYRRDLGHEGLAYEQEYILCGEETDADNLSGTVIRLLALREAENILSIRSDGAKMAEVHSMALATAAVMANPEMEEAVCTLIITVWAYVESLLDVRLLLNGGKVALIKSPAEWTSSLGTLGECLDVHARARDCADGLDYETYLFTLYTLEGQKKIAYRAMDLMEDAMHHKEGCGSVCMDRMLVSADFEMTITAAPIFLTFVPLLTRRIGDYEFVKEKQMSYL